MDAPPFWKWMLREYGEYGEDKHSNLLPFATTPIVGSWIFVLKKNLYIVRNHPAGSRRETGCFFIMSNLNIYRLFE